MGITASIVGIIEGTEILVGAAEATEIITTGVESVETIATGSEIISETAEVTGIGEAISSATESLGVSTLPEVVGTATEGVGSLAGLPPGVGGALGETVSGLLSGVTFSELASSILGPDAAGILSGFESEGIVTGVLEESGIELTSVEAETQAEINTIIEDTVESQSLNESEQTSLQRIGSKIKDNITFGLFKKVMKKFVEGVITYEITKQFMNLVFGSGDSKDIVVIDENKVKLNKDLTPFELATKIMDVINKVTNTIKFSRVKSEQEMIDQVESQFKNLNFVDRVFTEALWKNIKGSPIFQSEHSELFEKIFKIYDGKDMKTWKEYNPQTKRDNYFIQDETGLIEVYIKPPNPNSKTTFHGVWAGPWSYNNSLSVDIFDLFTHSHDISYQDSFFNLVGDMKLISRCLHNLDNVDFKLRAMMLGTIKYFSTAGITLSALTGRTSKINKFDVNNLEGDIFDKYKSKSTPTESDKEFSLNVSSAKQEFYEEMSYLYKRNYLNFMLNQGISYEDEQLENNNHQNDNLLNYFDNIEIELLS
jgi:hypothetical protein